MKTKTFTPANAQEWYDELNDREKRDYRDDVMEACGISDSSFYNYLKNEPPKLIAEKMAELAQLAVSKMWPKEKGGHK